MFHFVGNLSAFVLLGSEQMRRLPLMLGFQVYAVLLLVLQSRQTAQALHF